MTSTRHRLGACALGLLLLLAARPEARAQAPQPANPQPAAVQPGLVPTYYRNVPFDSVPEVIRYGSKPDKGYAGTPIPDINAKSSGALWESRMVKFYGIRIDGLIRLEAGTTAFSATSNDGFRLLIGGAQVLEDPSVHLDRTAGPASVTVTEAGWYPLRLWYFQKRGGATMELYWQPPGAAAAAPVPAAAFGHN
jgi:hypothetical protein